MDATVLWSGDGVLVIGVAAVLPRLEARQCIRAAVREAALKYSGLQLAEWNGSAPACCLQALPLPAPYVASLAF